MNDDSLPAVTIDRFQYTRSHILNRSSRPTVLIVDDNKMAINIMIDTLKDEYKLQVATNGKSALSTVELQAPDLILLDIVMPDMDGYQVCRKLKADIRTKDIPVIFVSANNEIEDEEKGLKLGAVDYISKPANPAIVSARVNTHLTLSGKNLVLERKVAERTYELERTQQNIISRLCAAADYRDNETGQHIHRMSNYSKLIALSYGLSEEAANLIMVAAPMHDVGKIGIPDSILQKSGKLNSEEWNIMKQHSEIGYKIIGNHQCELLNMASTIALSHHEKWNGLGYPYGLRGENIPFAGRIVAIADVFDALTSERPYKAAWPLEKALELVKSEKGEHFDPFIVDAFFEALPGILNVKDFYAE